jgi:hypothetical protein
VSWRIEWQFFSLEGAGEDAGESKSIQSRREMRFKQSSRELQFMSA